MESQLPNTRPTDSARDLLVDRIAALEVRMDALEVRVGVFENGWIRGTDDIEAALDEEVDDGWNEPDGTGYAAALDEDDPDGWIGGTECEEDD